MRLIDADAIRKIMYRKAFEEDSDLQRWDSGCWIRYKMFEQALKEAPTIEAEPVRRGKWLITPYTDYDDTYECSACGQWWMFVEGTPKENDANYCPNCGAKMRGEQDE